MWSFAYAGDEGIEPSLAVLETAVLPLNESPQLNLGKNTTKSPIRKPPCGGFRKLAGKLAFLVHSAHLAGTAELLQFNFAFDFLLVFAGVVVCTFALATLQTDEIILRHRK